MYNQRPTHAGRYSPRISQHHFPRLQKAWTYFGGKPNMYFFISSHIIRVSRNVVRTLCSKPSTRYSNKELFSHICTTIKTTHNITKSTSVESRFTYLRSSFSKPQQLRLATCSRKKLQHQKKMRADHYGRQTDIHAHVTFFISAKRGRHKRKLYRLILIFIFTLHTAK